MTVDDDRGTVHDIPIWAVRDGDYLELYYQRPALWTSEHGDKTWSGDAFIGRVIATREAAPVGDGDCQKFLLLPTI